MVCQTRDIVIQQGSTFQCVVRWETLPLVYRTITAITQASPVQITAAAHGVPDGWRVAVINAGGMHQINAKNWPLRDTDFHRATYVDTSDITLNDTSSGGFSPYTSGGALVYYTPVDLTSFTAAMQIRATVGAVDPPLISLISAVAPPLTGIAIDTTLMTISLLISATDTAAFTWQTGVYDLELTSSTGVVTQLLAGNVLVTDEVTRP